MDRCQLAPDFSIARILTGLWQIADMERDGATLDPIATANAIQPYVEAGFTTFDMADHYGSAEEIAGTYAQNHDANVQFLTKWVPEPGAVSAEELRAAVRRSLDRLQTDHIDLLQFHTWNYADLSYLDCLFALQDLQKEGLIRHLGLTNFDTAHSRIAVESGIEIVSNQVSVSLLDQRATQRLLPFCHEHGIHVLAYGTLAGGFLTDRWRNQPEPGQSELKTWSQKKYKRFIDVAGGWHQLQQLLNALYSIAQRHRCSIANVANRFVLDQPAIGGVIIGARLGESDHIQDNLNVAKLQLTEQDRYEIQTAVDELVPLPGDCGDEYRKPPFLTASGDLRHHLKDFPTAYKPTMESGARQKVSSNTPWEAMAGYSRAIRDGNRVHVSGTTATHGARTIGGTDAGAQTHFAIDKIEAALQSVGARLEDVVRTRIFVQKIANWEAVARAHGERFAQIRPVNTLVEAKLVGEEYLVEIEAEAITH